VLTNIKICDIIYLELQVYLKILNIGKAVERQWRKAKGSSRRDFSGER